MQKSVRQLPPMNALRTFSVAGRRLNFRAAAEELGYEAVVGAHLGDTNTENTLIGAAVAVAADPSDTGLVLLDGTIR